MFLTPNQLEVIEKIFERQTALFIGRSLGPEFLSTSEKKTLQGMGIDLDELYKRYNDPVLQNFHLGMLTGALPEARTKKLNFNELVKYISSGKHIPLNEREKATINSVKSQSLRDIKSINGRIFNDVNGIIAQEHRNDRETYEKVIRGEIERGIAERRTTSSIVQELGKKTGDWSRQWGKMVEYVSHQAFDEGRAAIYKKRGGEEALVFKQPYAGACKHCIRLYLTGGIGSKPKVFKLSELESNGTNIGRKSESWLPVVGSTHVHCRCTLHYLEPGQEWDEEKKRFVIQKEERKPKINRKPVKVRIGDEEYEV